MKVKDAMHKVDSGSPPAFPGNTKRSPMGPEHDTIEWPCPMFRD